MVREQVEHLFAGAYRIVHNKNFISFRSLQATALERLEARSNFSKSGQINLKLKLTKTLKKSDEKLQVTVDCSSNGEQLAQEIASLVRCLNICASQRADVFSLTDYTRLSAESVEKLYHFKSKQHYFYLL